MNSGDIIILLSFTGPISHLTDSNVEMHACFKWLIYTSIHLIQLTKFIRASNKTNIKKHIKNDNSQNMNPFQNKAFFVLNYVFGVEDYIFKFSQRALTLISLFIP